VSDAVVFLTHLCDRVTLDRFARLQADCTEAPVDAGSYDVFLSAEATVPIPPRYGHLTHRFEFSQLRSMAAAVMGDHLVPGNAHLRSLDFHLHHPGYSNYWFIEYDVVFHGDWGWFLSQFRSDRSDLLAPRARTIADQPDWHWWSTFTTGDDSVDPSEWISAFLPIHRLSNRGLTSVRGAVERGWVGHFEVLVPTAVAHDSLSIADIGGRGAWTPPERRNRFYLDHTLPDAYQCLGTVRFRPSIRWKPVRRVLYHPCKPAGDDSARWPLDLRIRMIRRALVSFPRQTIGYFVRLLGRTVWSRLANRIDQYR
jgi:hypothetical protein